MPHPTLLRRLVEQHARLTGSARAKRELGHWDRALKNFFVVVPREYRQVLERQAKASGDAGPTRQILSIESARSARHG